MQELSRLEAEQAALGSSSAITAEFLGITQVVFTFSKFDNGTSDIKLDSYLRKSGRNR